MLVHVHVHECVCVRLLDSERVNATKINIQSNACVCVCVRVSATECTEKAYMLNLVHLIPEARSARNHVCKYLMDLYCLCVCV